MLPSFETGKALGIPLRMPVLLVLAGVLIWCLGLRAEMLLQYRTELGGVEHNVIHGIQKVMLGQTLYEDPEQPPFDVIQYTPAYYLVCAGVGHILGLNGDDARGIYVLSRSVALLFNLSMALFVYRACRVAKGAPWSAFLAAGVSFACCWEHFFTRMDAMAGATSAASVFYFLRWCAGREQRWLVTAAVLAVLGAFTKQSGVVLVLAIVLHLLLQKDLRSLRTASTAMGIAGLMCLLVLLQLGSLPAFYQNTVLGLRNGVSLMMYGELFRPATYKYFIGWHALAALIAIKAYRSDDASFRYIALCIPLSLAFALITGLKYGSRLNYLHESLMLTFIGTSLLLPRLQCPVWRNGIAWFFAGYGILFAAFRTNSAKAWYLVGEPDATQERILRADEAVRDVLVNELGLTPRDKVFITYREYLEHFLVGQSMLTQKDIVQYSKDRLFDYAAFHRAMNDGSIRFVITDDANGPPSYLDSTYTGWEPVRTVHGRTILARSDRP